MVEGAVRNLVGLRVDQGGMRSIAILDYGS
jgi:hypothetical protein